MSPEERRKRRNELAALWRKENPEKVVASNTRRREAYKSDPSKYCYRSAQWKSRNLEKVSEKVRVRDAERIGLLCDAYVASKMQLPVSQVPPDLLELKRSQLAHKRALKELKEFLTEEEGKSK